MPISVYNRTEILNVISEAEMWNDHINNAMLWQFTPFPCATSPRHHSQYKSTHHTISCLYINNMILHQQSVPSHLPFNPNLPQFFSLSYLNLYQILTAYGLLTTVNFGHTTWQLKKNLNFNKQSNVSLKAQSFRLNGKTLSCSGYLKQTVLWPQKKTWRLKGRMLKAEKW